METGGDQIQGFGVGQMNVRLCPMTPRCLLSGPRKCSSAFCVCWMDDDHSHMANCVHAAARLGGGRSNYDINIQAGCEWALCRAGSNASHYGRMKGIRWWWWRAGQTTNCSVVYVPHPRTRCCNKSVCRQRGPLTHTKPACV